MSEATLKVWTNDEEWAFAVDKADLAVVLHGHIGEVMITEDWYEEDPTKSFAFRDEGCPDVRKTFAEWMKEKGRGYFACSDG